MPRIGVICAGFCAIGLVGDFGWFVTSAPLIAPQHPALQPLEFMGNLPSAECYGLVTGLIGFGCGCSCGSRLHRFTSRAPVPSAS